MAIERAMWRENLAVEEEADEEIRLLPEGQELVNGLTALAWAMQQGEGALTGATVEHPRSHARRTPVHRL